MNINRDNYESYFMDYLDSRLTSKEVRELYAFLLLNDDLREELEDLEQIKLHPQKINYVPRISLKKDEIHACPDYYGIATAEQSLTFEDVEFLKKHPDYQKTASIYRQIKLKPDQDIHFTNKAKLYRPQRYIAAWIRISAVAAIICLLTGIHYILTSGNKITKETPTASALYFPDIPEVEINDILPIRHAEHTEIIHQPRKILAKTESKDNVRQKDPGLMALFRPSSVPIAINPPQPDYTLITSGKRTLVIQAEIFLAETATNWKPSERNILSDNIFNSMINAGKTLADKIKNKEQ